MATSSKSFTAVGLGMGLYVRHADSFTYDVSGTFVGTVVLKKSMNAGVSYETVSEVAAITGSASGTVKCEVPDKSGATFIFECTAFTSGTIVTALADAVKVLKEFTDEGGNPIFQIKEDGIKVFGNVVSTGSSSGSGLVEFTHGADIASATATNLETATGNVVDVTGTTTITSIVLSEGHVRIVRFTGALTLTHGASLVLPTSANITTAAGDYAIFAGYASSVVRCIAYEKLSGAANKSVANADVAAAAAIAFSKLAALTDSHILVGSGSNVATDVAVTGDVVISNAGVTAISSGVIVNADVNASAAIDFSKLAALTSTNILVGSSGNVATSTAVTGDVTIGNTGVTAIAAGVIVNADINASAAIAGTKITPTFAARVFGNAGNGTSSALRMDGSLYNISSNTNNTSTGETDLHTTTVGANTLSADYNTLHVKGTAFLANNANAKTINIYFGTKAFPVVSAITTANKYCSYDLWLTRTGAGTQRAVYRSDVSGTAAVIAVDTASIDETQVQTVKSTGTGGATSDITESFFSVQFIHGG